MTKKTHNHIDIPIDLVYQKNYKIHVPISHIIKIKSKLVTGAEKGLDVKIERSAIVLSYKYDSESHYKINIYGCNEKHILCVSLKGYSTGLINVKMFDKKKIGTNGGTAFSNSWIVREINSITTNTTIAMLNNNIITLKEGNYAIYVQSTFFQTGATKIRLKNIDTNVVLDESINNTVDAMSVVSLFSDVTVLNSLNIVLEYICEYNSVDTGLGFASGFTEEIYTLIHIVKQ